SITDVGDDGIGYTFITYDSTDMYMAINRAIDGYKNKEKWQQTVIKAMNTDFSWSKSADEYIKIYERLLEDKI
ncbi:MAG: starch synthase, partial [Clostridia bacterium]|nr:starch synthase [Clostridia bacterium]